MNRPILYYIAAALFATAAVITFGRDGDVTVKAILGVVMCGIMIWLGTRVTIKTDV